MDGDGTAGVGTRNSRGAAAVVGGCVGSGEEESGGAAAAAPTKASEGAGAPAEEASIGSSSGRLLAPVQ